MALPSSGQISMSQVNTELGYSSTATISLNDSAVRSLFQKTGSGTTISMSDGWGKSACPAYGTYLYSACSGTDYYAYYANGTCGTYSSLIESNSCSCGGSGPPSGTPTGTSYCIGTTFYEVFYNGSCGTYTDTTTNSCNCGGTGPSYGTPTGYTYCSGSDYYVEYYNGNCGTYTNNEGQVPCQCGVSDGHYYGELNYTFCLGCSQLGSYYCGNCCCCYTDQIQACTGDCGSCCTDCNCFPFCC